MNATRGTRGLASLGRRARAGCIDAACLLGSMAGGMGAMLVWDTVRDGGHVTGLEHTLERWSALTQSPRWRRAGSALAVGSAVGLRNWRSPGMRVMGIHREDVRAGGPVTVRAALICHVAGQARGRLVKRVLLVPRYERYQEEVRALGDDVEAIRRQHPDDAGAQQRAIQAVYREAGVNPLSCCWPAFVPAVIDVLVTLSTPRHQSSADWIAGIVVVND
jgi:hypothetical protein